MINQDTVELLKECDAGVKMGVRSIDEVLPKVSSKELLGLLMNCKAEHEEIQQEIEKFLQEYGDDGKNPNPVAKGMAWMKTNVMLSVEPTDQMIADLMTEGCNMGIKSLSKYLNQYESAGEKAKDQAKKLVQIEERLVVAMRGFL